MTCPSFHAVAWGEGPSVVSTGEWSTCSRIIECVSASHDMLLPREIRVDNRRNAQAWGTTNRRMGVGTTAGAHKLGG